ncbi:hypothetical protein EDB81DRAFT_940101 [Dactylonectria macrodidyma]|uniref:Uncharacterized protein n=1 Tax=Dactylonectria macrodidyma TaxID=307937 RepID=A0A9P9FSZ5_9HYPO|nr:hypothetical protein EDB81DRAFT_940101 [Dactylonectria macrodidyma]
MKLLLAFLISSLVALVSAVAIDTDLANAKRELDEITTRDNAEVFAITEDNKLVVTVDGSVEGTLVLTEDQDVKIFDADGNEISLDEFLDDDDENNEKRWLPVAVRVLRMLAPVIRRWGSRALKFFRCVGLDARLIGCAQQFSNCLSTGRPPWQCVGGITCLGKVGKACAKK